MKTIKVFMVCGSILTVKGFDQQRTMKVCKLYLDILVFII